LESTPSSGKNVKQKQSIFKKIKLKKNASENVKNELKFKLKLSNEIMIPPG